MKNKKVLIIVAVVIIAIIIFVLMNKKKNAAPVQIPEGNAESNSKAHQIYDAVGGNKTKLDYLKYQFQWVEKGTEGCTKEWFYWFIDAKRNTEEKTGKNADGGKLTEKEALIIRDLDPCLKDFEEAYRIAVLK